MINPTPHPETPPLPEPPALQPINWLEFFAFLFAPAILACISIAVKIPALAMGLGLFAPLYSGFRCATILLKPLRGNRTKYLLAVFALWPVFAALGYGLCFLGCSVGGLR